MEMAVKAAAMEERARWRRRGRPAAAVAHGGGHGGKGKAEAARVAPTAATHGIGRPARGSAAP